MSNESTTPEEGLDTVSEIDRLLMESFEDEGNQEGDDSKGESKPSTDEDESGKEKEQDESEDDLTWSKVLGISDNQIDVDDNGDLKGLKVKVDGVVSTVPVSELIAGYQQQKYVTQKSQALSEEKRTFDAVREQAASVFVEKLQIADRLTQVLQNSLMKEYQGIDWRQLRDSNPSEYAATLIDFQGRQAQIQQVMDSIKQEMETVQQQSNQTNQQKFQEHLRNQYERLVERNPTWRNAEAFKADMIAMGEAATAKYGITPDEFAMLSDARHIEILRDALAFQQGKTVAEKKVTNVPKFEKGGKSTKPMDQLTRLKLAAGKAKGIAKSDLQSAAINELLKLG